VAPGLFVALVRALEEYDLHTVAELHRRALSLMALGTHSDPPIGAIKLAIKKLGVSISSMVLRPALSAPPKAEEVVEAVLQEAGLLPVAQGV
jgi:dihydrodipicolinate synthase/N-acetylneuraminate lyase